MIPPAERAVVLLAAGLGRRFGGSPKLLAPYRGRPLIVWAADAGAQVPAARHAVVLGHDAAAIAAAIGEGPYARIDNPDPEAGLAHSLRLGLAPCAGAAAVAVLLGDMPEVTPALITALFGCLGERFAAVPRAGERWGNPVVLSARAVAAASALTGDRGARPLLESAADDLAFLDTDDPAIFRDVDRREDLVS